jgi:hypothetical protein
MNAFFSRKMSGERQFDLTYKNTHSNIKMEVNNFSCENEGIYSKKINFLIPRIWK